MGRSPETSRADAALDLMRLGERDAYEVVVALLARSSAARFFAPASSSQSAGRGCSDAVGGSVDGVVAGELPPPHPAKVSEARAAVTRAKRAIGLKNECPTELRSGSRSTRLPAFCFARKAEAPPDTAPGGWPMVGPPARNRDGEWP